MRTGGEEAMTDTPNTNPDANTIMVLSITTASGPRSIITNTLPLRDANLIAATLQAAGHYAEVRPMGAVYSLAEHMQKHRARRAKAAMAASGVTMFPTKARRK
jgi:hypothetical protein